MGLQPDRVGIAFMTGAEQQKKTRSRRVLSVRGDQAALRSGGVGTETGIEIDDDIGRFVQPAYGALRVDNFQTGDLQHTATGKQLGLGAVTAFRVARRYAQRLALHRHAYLDAKRARLVLV